MNEEQLAEKVMSKISTVVIQTAQSTTPELNLRSL